MDQKMNRIIQLPKNLSDKIAAGEVVTGPVSVVKELVENSIDAGADSITIEIKDGGRTSIRVTDNGSGIPEDEVELAFMPHATSKISDEDDLENINTLGFRGEALTSIAAVSKLEMITMTDDKRVGTSVYIEGGELIEKKDIGARTGTTILVKDLFFNTPARLKFMKSDRAESTKIIDMISRIAIAYPDIKMRLVSNDNILFSTNGKGDVLNNILQVYGTEKKEDLLEIREQAGSYRINAYVSPSSHTKKTRKSQIYFVNGRVVNSKTIENAISKGYEEFLFEGRYPIAYVFLEIDPGKLDVNVHPAKTEVRFNEQPILSNFIYQAIYNRLKTKEAIPDILSSGKKKIPKQNVFKLDQDVNKSEPKSNQRSGKIEQVNIKSLMSTYANDTKTTEQKNENKVAEPSPVNYEPDMTIISDKTAAPKMQEGPDISNLKVLGSIFATYILAIDDDMFYIIDQHAAHERVNYEMFLEQFHGSEKLSQQILEPLVINVSATLMSKMEDWIEIINKLGFEAEIFGDKSIIVKAVPAFITFSEAEDMINDIIDNMGDSIPKNDKAIEKLIQRSCKASVKANDLLKPTEIQALLGDLSKCHNPFSCPHGRPVFVKLSKYDVEKLFRRV